MLKKEIMKSKILWNKESNLFKLLREIYTYYNEREDTSLIDAAIDCRTLEREVSGQNRRA